MFGSTPRSSFAFLVLSSFGVALTLASACGVDEVSVFDAGPKEDTFTPQPYVPPLDAGNGRFADFSKDPILDTAPSAPPSDIASLFAGATAATTGGPCLMEPEIGSIYPKNWLRPRFRFIPNQGLTDGGASPFGNVFEVRLHVDNQDNDLVVYTTSSAWTMPAILWDSLREHSAGIPMTLTVRQGTYASGALTSVSAGSGGPISIAPVDAPGTIVYWTTTGAGGSSGVYNPVLKAFKVGDEKVQEVLRPAQVPGGQAKCLGCHSSTPDGIYAAVSWRKAAENDGDTFIAFTNAVDAGKASFLTPQAETLINRTEQEMPVFTKAHYKPGDRIGLTMFKAAAGFDIIWTDLETTSTAQDTGWGIFARTGDPKPWAALASPAHDGSSIVYVSTNTATSAGTIVSNGELRTIPYGARKGGTSTELVGANDPASKQFYPSYSPDDKYVAFDRAPTGYSSYNDPKAEIHVIPAAGGTALRLAANDPPACSGATSPGVYNSWPKWSPAVRSKDGKDYYFLVFSSARNSGSVRFGARLYVTTLVVENGVVTSSPSLFLWNQPANEDNHSPSWDELAIAPPN